MSSTDPYGEPVEEEVVETRRTVPTERRVVRRSYMPGGDPMGSLVGLIILILVILFVLELLGVINLTNSF